MDAVQHDVLVLGLIFLWAMGSRKPGSTSPPSKLSVRSKMLTCLGD
jgi:hypothetical protein